MSRKIHLKGTLLKILLKMYKIKSCAEFCLEKKDGGMIYAFIRIQRSMLNSSKDDRLRRRVQKAFAAKLWSYYCVLLTTTRIFS